MFDTKTIIILIVSLFILGLLLFLTVSSSSSSTSSSAPSSAPSSTPASAFSFSSDASISQQISGQTYDLLCADKDGNLKNSKIKTNETDLQVDGVLETNALSINGSKKIKGIQFGAVGASSDGTGTITFDPPFPKDSNIVIVGNIIRPKHSTVAVVTIDFTDVTVNGCKYIR
jgi:hypothetical protein